MQHQFTPPSTEEIVDAIGWMFPEWAHQCHAVSLSIVKSGILPAGSRVARGTARGVGGQHSWIVVQTDGSGELADCYADDAVIIDPTLWSYVDEVEDVWVGEVPTRFRHNPHGKGPHIMEQGRPPAPTGKIVELNAEAHAGLSKMARFWVDEMFGPLDLTGWRDVANNTSVVGWPAGEVLAAMDDTPELSVHIPIDLIGMLTDRNPNGLFLAGAEQEAAV